MAYNNQQADPVSAVLIALVECIFALFRGVGWVIGVFWRMHRTAAARRRIEMAMEAAEAQRQEQAAQLDSTPCASKWRAVHSGQCERGRDCRRRPGGTRRPAERS